MVSRLGHWEEGTRNPSQNPVPTEAQDKLRALRCVPLLSNTTGARGDGLVEPESQTTLPFQLNPGRESTAPEENPAAGHLAPPPRTPASPAANLSWLCPRICSRPAGLPAYMAPECPGCRTLTIRESGSPPLASRSWQRRGAGRVTQQPPRRAHRRGERAKNLGTAVPREGTGASGEVGRTEGPPAATWHQMLHEDLPCGRDG